MLAIDKRSTLLLATVLSVFLFLKGSVAAFQCYVCDSKNDIDCVENFPDDTRLQPQNCDNISGAKYCIKTTNLYAGELGTKRFCSANDHGNYCKYNKQPTGDREYRSCVLTCSSDNCNGAEPKITSRWITLMIGLASALSLIAYSGRRLRA